MRLLKRRKGAVHVFFELPEKTMYQYAFALYLHYSALTCDCQLF